jgi:hypothetical protein
MTVNDYRGPQCEDEVLVRAEKVYPSDIFSCTTTVRPHYLALIQRLDKLKGTRNIGALFVREESEPEQSRAWICRG